MVVAARGRAGVVLVPELHELPSVFLPDPERARRAGLLVEWLLRHRRDVPCDLGGGGLTAAEAAHDLRADRWARALVLASPPDGDAEAEHFVQRVLVEALQGAGLDVEVAAPDVDPVTWLQARLGPPAEAGGWFTAAPLLLYEGPERLLFERPDQLLFNPPGFLRSDDGAWRQTGCGVSGPLPLRGVHRLRLLAPDELRPDEPAELLAFTDWASRARATVQAVREAGAERCRLVGRPRSRAEWRTLREIVVEAFPALLPELDVVLGWREQDVRPLHELYAGRGLVECNARLVENLQP